uniref:Uncharacterized protein n=1 Tax=Rhizophora mucronata TaxID=61149 RepID=A0A2P2NX23_RHIMU
MNINDLFTCICVHLLACVRERQR